MLCLSVFVAPTLFPLITTMARASSSNAQKEKCRTRKSPEPQKLSKVELKEKVLSGKIPVYNIEKYSKTSEDAVEVRRKYYGTFF